MTAIKTNRKNNRINAVPQIYPTWESFVQAKLDQANYFVSRMDQEALRKLISSKK